MSSMNLIHPSSYALFALRRKGHRLGHALLNSVRKKDICIAGSYFTGNLGDWTMGQAFLRSGDRDRARLGLVDYRCSSMSGCGLIMGGGELGDIGHFEDAFRLSGDPAKTVACGMNPVYTFSAFPDELLTKIKRMPYVSVRSKVGAELMRSVLSREDVEYNPDPAFSFTPDSPPPNRTAKRLGISLLTFYLSLQKRRMFASDQTMKSIVADPEFAAQIDGAGLKYIEMMNRLIEQALAAGWEVVNIPFTEVDALFAESVFGKRNIKRIPYSRNPGRVLDVLRTCQRFVAGRFHAHIFGLMAQVPVVSISYAGKTHGLWQDLRLDSDLQISRLDICQKPRESADRLLEQHGVRLPSAELNRLAGQSRQSIIKAIEAVR